MDMEDGHHGEDTPGSDTDTGDTGVVDTEDTEVSIQSHCGVKLRKQLWSVELHNYHCTDCNYIYTKNDVL